MQGSSQFRSFSVNKIKDLGLTDYSTTEDGLLLKLLADSDELALSELFSRYRAKLYDYLFSITKNREIAEELLLDVYLKLWLGRELVPQIHNLEGFLKTVARNKAFNFLRIAAKKKHLQQLVAYELSQQADRSAEDRLIDKEYQALLQKAIAQLSPQRKLVYTLSREQGLSHEEIARELALSRQTVKNYMTDALKTIQEFLASEKGEQALVIFMVWVLS